MRQERIVKTPRRRTTVREEPAPALVTTAPDTTDANEVVAQIDRLLEAV